MEEMWRRPACRGLFYSLWTQEERGAGSLGWGGGRYRPTALWDLSYMGAELFSLKGCDARSSCKRVGG